MISKFEAVMGKFIWGGVSRIFRVFLVELKNPCMRGGMSLVSIWSMADSLRLMQLLRLLKSSDGKSISNINWWIGDFSECVVCFFVVGGKLIFSLSHWWI